MSNLIDARKVLLLAALLVSVGGYGIYAASLPEDPAPEMRYRVDTARQRVWLLTGDAVVVDAAPEKSTVPLPGWQVLLPPWGCFPDLALGPDGEAVITSNVLPTLWRVDPETLAVSVHPLALDVDREKDVGFSRIVYSPRDAAYFAVGSFDGAVWSIDPRLASARKLASHERPSVALGQRGARVATCALR
jgi:hypothetical protein